MLYVGVFQWKRTLVREWGCEGVVTDIMSECGLWWVIVLIRERERERERARDISVAGVSSSPPLWAVCGHWPVSWRDQDRPLLTADCWLPTLGWDVSLSLITPPPPSPSLSSPPAWAVEFRRRGPRSPASDSWLDLLIFYSGWDSFSLHLIIFIGNLILLL